MSQNRPQDEADEEEAAAALAAVPQSPGAPPAPKAKEKHREQPVETEVDRIIDAQDNEYVLSKPKCVVRPAQPSPAGARGRS